MKLFTFTDRGGPLTFEALAKVLLNQALADGQTKASLAANRGLSANTISNISRGYNVSAKTLDRLLRVSRRRLVQVVTVPEE